MDLKKDFTGRVAIVTGAARGLGRAAAARLHERGAAVAVNVRDRERAESVAKAIGERALAVPGDLAAAGVTPSCSNTVTGRSWQLESAMPPIEPRL